MKGDEPEVAPGVHAPDVEGDQIAQEPDGLAVIPGPVQFRCADDRIVVPIVRADAGQNLLHLEAGLTPASVTF